MRTSHDAWYASFFDTVLLNFRLFASTRSVLHGVVHCNSASCRDRYTEKQKKVAKQMASLPMLLKWGAIVTAIWSAAWAGMVGLLVGEGALQL